jgi:hypothetical protein
MGRINWGRVIGGGLLAGVVLNIIDYVVNGVILKTNWNAAMTALQRPVMNNSMIMYFVIADFLTGVFLVWLYAAIRPRFGAGAMTAVIAGLAFFAVMGVIHTVAEANMGLFPRRLLLMSVTPMIIGFPIAAVVGAWPYREEGDAMAGAPSGRRMAGAA